MFELILILIQLSEMHGAERVITFFKEMMGKKLHLRKRFILSSQTTQKQIPITV